MFQCENCGCKENTALSDQRFVWHEEYDWTGIEDRKGKALCSACGPAKFKSGEPTEYGGKWHGVFERVYLPMGQYKTNAVGNLELKTNNRIESQ